MGERKKLTGKETMNWTPMCFFGIKEWDESHKGRVVPKVSVQAVVQAVDASLGHAGTLPTRKELEKQ